MRYPRRGGEKVSSPLTPGADQGVRGVPTKNQKPEHSTVAATLRSHYSYRTEQRQDGAYYWGELSKSHLHLSLPILVVTPPSDTRRDSIKNLLLRVIGYYLPERISVHFQGVAFAVIA